MNVVKENIKRHVWFMQYMQLFGKCDEEKIAFAKKEMLHWLWTVSECPVAIQFKVAPFGGMLSAEYTIKFYDKNFPVKDAQVVEDGVIIRHSFDPTYIPTEEHWIDRFVLHRKAVQRRWCQMVIDMCNNLGALLRGSEDTWNPSSDNLRLTREIPSEARIYINRIGPRILNHWLDNQKDLIEQIDHATELGVKFSFEIEQKKDKSHNDLAHIILSISDHVCIADGYVI